MSNTSPFIARRRQLSSEGVDAIWSAPEAPPAQLTSSAVIARGTSRVPAEILAAFERILVAGPAPGETYGAAAERKEREILAQIESLTAVQALQLQRSLEAGERVAFERLSVERRLRIVRALERHRLPRRAPR